MGAKDAKLDFSNHQIATQRHPSQTKNPPTDSNCWRQNLPAQPFGASKNLLIRISEPSLFRTLRESPAKSVLAGDEMADGDHRKPDWRADSQ
jgi:hypothetical protein